jgi:hypothetical protein
MDSTARLVRLDAGLNAGSDAPHVDLSFHFLPVRQRDIKEDNPITRHRKLQLNLVATRLCFSRLSEQGTHPRMRHVRLNCYVRPGEKFAGGIGQLQIDRDGTDPRRLRRNLVLNRNKRRRFDRSGTADRK